MSDPVVSPDGVRGEPLEGRVALITGASRGIGAATARRLVASGVKVGLTSRSGADLGLPGALGLACDVRDAAALADAASATATEFGGIDILIANAGVGWYGSFSELDLDDLDEMLDINLRGTVYAVRAALPFLTQSERADILAVSSEAGRRGIPGEAVYSATKFGQVGFIRALDGELREQGIRCTNLCPGGVATEFAIGRGREVVDTEGMMTADDIADLMIFVLTRPRHMRYLETALRPMIEASWG